MPKNKIFYNYGHNETCQTITVPMQLFLVNNRLPGPVGTIQHDVSIPKPAAYCNYMQFLSVNNKMTDLFDNHDFLSVFRSFFGERVSLTAPLTSDTYYCLYTVYCHLSIGLLYA